MEYLIDNIPKYIPTEIDNLKPCLLHGDFRLDNMILEKNKSIPRIIGLLDWELSTLSPPFIDLSYWVLMLRFEKTWPIGGLSNFNNQKSYSNSIDWDLVTCIKAALVAEYAPTNDKGL